MISSVRFLANIAHDFWGKRSKLEELKGNRGSAAGTRAFEYARGKLSPFAGVSLDVASQSDAIGRPLPFSSDKLSYRAKQLGFTERYGYKEYASQKLLPIPMEEAAREIWKDQGVSPEDASKWLRAITIGALSGTTGARVSPERPPITAKQIHHMDAADAVNAFGETSTANRSAIQKEVLDRISNAKISEAEKLKLRSALIETLRKK